MGRHVKDSFPEDIFYELPKKSKGARIAHARKRRKPRPVLRLFGATFMALVIFAGTALGFMYADIQGNITAQEVDSLIGENRPTPVPVTPQSSRPVPGPAAPMDPFSGKPVNILVMGSDVRSEEDADFGATSGMRSDTTLLVHVSADRERVDAISIPRDSWVAIPSCERADGSWTQPRTSKFNAAFALGGANGDVGSAAACAIKTVEHLTGVYIDAYAVVDFTGFENIVDSLGGVEMCIPQRIDSPKAHLYLEPGIQVLDGQTALGYARARSGEGLTGSDISRIDRQQELFDAIASDALDSMTDIPTLYRFISAVTSTLTVSPNIAGLTNAAGFAWSLRGMDDLNFYTVPFVAHPDGNNVLWTQEADEWWDKLVFDQPIEDKAPAPESTDEPDAEEPSSDATDDAPETPVDPVVEASSQESAETACA